MTKIDYSVGKRPKNDWVTFKVSELVRNLNKDMKSKFDELESKRFKGHKKAYFFVCEKFGSAFLESALEIYFNGIRGSYWNLNPKR